MQSLDAIFIAPPFEHGNETMWKQFDYFFPPYGLAHIASYIRQFGYKSIIIDCLVESKNLLDFENVFREKYYNKVHSKLFAITAVTPIIDNALFIADVIKKLYPESTVVLGGPHPSHLYQELIKNKNIDIIVIGEGEITFKEIIDGNELKEINGISYKETINGKSTEFLTPPRERIKNPDILPIPAYDLLQMQAYKAPKYSNQNIPSMSMVTSRGCIGKCSFCSKIFHEVYFMSAERVLAEIEHLYNNYGVRQIIFYDDTFTIDVKRVKEICALITERKIDIRWTCFARVDCVDYETLVAMKNAGCEHIMYGVENFNEEVLKKVNKKINIEQVFQAVRLTKKAGITCRVSLMIGNPGETKAIIKQNMRMIHKLRPDYLQVLIFHPLPGAPLYDHFKNNNLITATNWSEFNFTKPLFIHETLSQKTIRNYYILMYLNFYLSPWFILSQLRKIFIKNERKRLIWGLKAFVTFVYKNMLLTAKIKK